MLARRKNKNNGTTTRKHPALHVRSFLEHEQAAAIDFFFNERRKPLLRRDGFVRARPSRDKDAAEPEGEYGGDNTLNECLRE